MLTLHYTPKTVAAAVAITLNEVGADYSLKKVDFAAAEQKSPDYLKINPKGRVPALITDQGVLTETIALLEYVNALYPDAALVPADPFQAARMRSLMTYLASTFHVNHAMGGRGERWGTKASTFDDLKSKVTENITENCTYIEENVLSDTPFLGGDRFSIGDAYLYTVSTWLPSDGVSIVDFPKLDAFQQNISRRPSVVKAAQDGVL